MTDGRNGTRGKRVRYDGRDRRSTDTRIHGSSYENRVENEGVISGRNAVRELLATERDIDKIFVLKGEREGSAVVLIAQARERRIPVVEVERQKLDSMAGHNRHQGIVAVASSCSYCTVDDILEAAEQRGEKPFIIICNDIEDPHNLGAIIRSAECSGAHGVIIPKRHAVGITSVVSKASAGAVEHMKVAKVTNIAETVEYLKKKNVWVYGADMEGDIFYETKFDSAVALVLGSEGNGISRLVLEKCDFRVSIPMYGQVNSLNVSNAGAILMSEIARQRHIK